MATGLDLKERMSFRIAFAKLWYGNGPFDNIFRPREDDQINTNQGCSILYLELKGGHYKRRQLVGRRPVIARLHRHLTGQELTGMGVPVRGQMDLGEINDDRGSRGYVEIFGFLPQDVFDTIAS